MPAGMSKIVLSRTLEPLTWTNTQLIPRDVVQVVRELKDKEDASSMRTMGNLGPLADAETEDGDV